MESLFLRAGHLQDKEQECKLFSYFAFLSWQACFNVAVFGDGIS